MNIATGNNYLTETLVDQVLAMRTQEDNCYSYRNCFPNGGTDQNLNVTWREKICHWCYNVVDHFDLSREIVSVSLNLFDRFLVTRGNKCNGNMALLASLATLHLSIKLHETKKIKLTTLANLSRGQFDPCHIEEMEWNILSALGWKVHPPTESAFINHLLVFLPQEAHPAVRKDLLELSRYLSELAVCDSFFVDFNASSVAFASILNVMEDMSYSRLSAGLREKFLRDLADKVHLNYNDPKVVAARERIKAMFAASVGYSGPSSAKVITPQHNHRMVDVSPSNFGRRSRSNSGESFGRRNNSNRSRTSSGDSIGSKGSCRYSPSPARRLCTVRSVGRLSSSPIVASVQ